MKIKFSFLPVLILVFGTFVLAQEVTDKNPEADSAELQEKAVEYLRETAGEVNSLRTVENRISFSSELANLMWYHDEKEARKMFSVVADNFVQLLTEADARLGAYGGIRDENDFFGGFSLARDERGDAARKMFKAISVREQIALAIAEHDAQLSYDFVVRTTATITDKKLAETFESQNKRLEQKIIERMGVRDAESSLAFGRKSLKRGFNTELVSLAMKVYEKDPDAAIEFAEELVDKVRSEASSEQESLSHMYSILQAGGDGEEPAGKGKKPLFSNAALKSLAELFAEKLLRAEDFESYMLDQYVGVIEVYSPADARRVRAKFAEQDRAEKTGIDRMREGADRAADAAKAAADAVRDGADNPSPEQAAAQAREEERDKLIVEVEEFGSGELTKEQKSEFVGKARRKVSDMNDPTVKVATLSALAMQVKMLGDAELATEIMREANALVKSDPRNFMDYMLVWSLATGYSQVSPEEAFPLVENAIYRLNDTIDGAIKVAEFIDVKGDFVLDGEVQLGAFGGSMIRGALSMLGESDTVLASLAATDFDRTKALAQSFGKPEVRILARFMILRSVLVKGETQDIGLLK